MHYQTQQTRLLTALLKNGNTGVNSYDATYRLGIKQAPTRISELKQKGYMIVVKHNSDRSVNWVLLHVPKDLEKTTKLRLKPQANIPSQPEYEFLIENGIPFARLKSPIQEKLL